MNLLMYDRNQYYIFTVDCLRADRLGCYGYDAGTTLNIDSLAENGVRYENCFSTGPRTNKSFPGIITSPPLTDYV